MCKVPILVYKAFYCIYITASSVPGLRLKASNLKGSRPYTNP